MSQIPPAALLRLREADVVRFCGLAAAARGLDAVARHVVVHARRLYARLEATVEGSQPSHVWVEASDDQAAVALRFGCDCPDMSADNRGSLGCEHVAAVLTAWIRTPVAFNTPSAPEPTAPGASASTPRQPLPSGEPLQQPEHLTQPILLSPPAVRRSRGNLSLADELERFSAHELMDLARRVYGFDPSQSSDLVARDSQSLDEVRLLLAAHLRDPRKVALLLDRLDARARLLLGDIALMGGVVTSADLDALAERSDRSADALRTEAAALARHGLLFHVAGAQSPPEPGSHTRGQIAGWRVAGEILTALQDALPATLPALPTRDAHGPPLLMRASQEQPERKPARVVRGSPALLLLTLALLAYAPRPYNPLLPSLTPLTSPDPANTRGLESRLHASASHQPQRSGAHAFPLVPGDLAPQVIAEFGRGANVPTGLARLARRVLLWARDGDSGTVLLDLATLPASERILALRGAFQVWRSAESPTELADLALDNAPIRLRLDYAHEALRPATLAAEAREARDMTLRLLGRVASDTWHTFDDLLDLIWRVRPLFLRGRQQTYITPAWWLERASERRPLRPTIREEWRVAEGGYVRALLTGPLQWFGAFDLAYDATEAAGIPLAFRLTAIGRYLLAGDHDAASHEAEARAALAGLTPEWGAPLVPTRDGHLAVQPLAAPGADLLTRLAAWARPTTVAGRRIIYALAPDRACEMFDRGVTPDVLLTYLRAVDPASGTRAATAVEPQLRSWHAAYGRSHIETGWALIEAQDEAALVEALATVPDLSVRCRRLSPSIALVPPDDAPTLEAALARRGYAV